MPVSVSRETALVFAVVEPGRLEGRFRSGGMVLPMELDAVPTVSALSWTESMFVASDMVDANESSFSDKDICSCENKE